MREVYIAIYLFIFKWIFSFFKLFPLQTKTVCVASFGDNIFYTTRELSERTDEKIIILKEATCRYPFNPKLVQVLPFDMKRPFTYIRGIYHLATATTILIDNYFGFLEVTNFKKGVTCIQLWHAIGALKQFGLQDSSIKTRSPRAIKRFHQVYARFDYIPVGSDKMATVFTESFGRPPEIMLKTGVPRTDFFFSDDDQMEVLLKLKKLIPSLDEKKVILYAPTYRDNQIHDFQIKLDFERLYEEFSSDYILLIKLHPAVSYELDQAYKQFIFDVTDYFNINHLLMVTDILITDYSSVPYEYSLLSRPIIFYTYDLEEYKKLRGLSDNYFTELPGPLVYTHEELIETIKRGEFDLVKVRAFSAAWNQYSKGDASKRLVDFILEETR